MFNEEKNVSLKNLWLEKNVSNSILFFPSVGLLYKLCVRQICDREIQCHCLLSNVWLTMPLNPTYSSLAQN